MQDRTLNKLGIVVSSAVAWYFVFWYFALPDQPYTFKNELGWRIQPDQFPYTSSTAFEDLPAPLQQGYLIGYVAVIGLSLVLDWIIQGIRSLFA
jgi:hypothetical protein